jgi:large subunit ribosomal protein L24
MSKLKIRKGDKVCVITGKDKGKTGVVLKTIPSQMKLVVEGVNVAKKHVKPSQSFPQGGVFPREQALHYSNVQILDPKTDQPSRIGYKFLADNKKVRISRRSGEIIDNA